MSDNRNTGNVIGGHKANISNPKTSEEAKEHSRQVIDELESGSAPNSNSRGDSDEYEAGQQGVSGETTDGKNAGNVIGGHKANLANPRTSDESKEHSKQVIDELV